MRDGGWQGGGKGASRPDPRSMGGRRPVQAPRRSPQELLAERIAHLQASAGLPLDLAREVAAGRAELNDVLKKMAQADEVERLIAHHGIDKALAWQVVMGLIDLQKVLTRRRIAAHLAEFRGRDALAEAVGGAEVVLGVHGRQVTRGRVVAIRPYEIVFALAEGGEEQLLHKTTVKYLAQADVWQKARKAMTWDDARKRADVGPILRPQDRFGCSNTRLGEAWAGGAAVRLTLLEGEIFVGQVSWVSRWDFGLATRGGTVVVLRHALAEFGDQD